MIRLTSCDGADDEKRFFSGRNLAGQRGIGRFEGEIFSAREEPQKRPTLLRDMVANGPCKHGVACFERIQHGALGNRAFYLELYLRIDLRQCSQMIGEHHADHFNV